MTITAADVKKLREATAAPMLECKKALEANDGDFDKAVRWLLDKGLAKAAKKADRAVREGIIEAYVHPGNRVAVMIEVNCETDFVARSAEFKQLVRNLLLQIAMSNPKYLDSSAVPAADLEKEIEANPPLRPEKYYQEVCLLDQPVIRDESQTVRQLIQAAIGTIGENIVVSRFARYELGL